MIKKIFIGIGILLTAVLVGAGWYFSGLIYEIGFNVNNKENNKSSNESSRGNDRIDFILRNYGTDHVSPFID